MIRTQIRYFDNPAEFQSETQEFLARHEAQHNLLLGRIEALAHDEFKSGTEPSPQSSSTLVSVREKESVAGVALITPSRPLALSLMSRNAAALLAKKISGEKLAIPGVVGPPQAAMEFVKAWKKCSKIEFSSAMKMHVYELSRVTPPLKTSGNFAFATESDQDEVVPFIEAFLREATIDSQDAETVAKNCCKERRLAVWRDPDIVAIAGFSGRTKTGARINLVYTPPEKRGLGYASNVVAFLSQWLLDSGLKKCFLFADVTNPASNRIYQKLGYRKAGKSHEYRFAYLHRVPSNRK